MSCIQIEKSHLNRFFSAIPKPSKIVSHLNLIECLAIWINQDLNVIFTTQRAVIYVISPHLENNLYSESTMRFLCFIIVSFF